MLGPHVFKRLTREKPNADDEGKVHHETNNYMISLDISFGLICGHDVKCYNDIKELPITRRMWVRIILICYSGHNATGHIPM